jgi:ketosteroid isomerase-like protein
VPAVEPHPVMFPLRAAMEARDLSAVMACFAPDAVFRSPFTANLAFTGREQIRALVTVLFEVFEDLHYTGEARGENTAFLAGRARIGGEDVEFADHLRLRPDGTIAEFTVFFRPLPATAVALRVIGAGLARRKSPVRALVISALARPLAVMTRAGDGIGVRLIRSAL